MTKEGLKLEAIRYLENFKDCANCKNRWGDCADQLDEYCLKNGCCFATPKEQDIYLASAEPREKRIEELEKENAELKADNDARKFAMAMSEKVEKQLREENAELRKIAEFQQSSNMSRHFENKKLKEGLAVGSTFNKALNSMNKALEEERDKYRNMVFDKNDQLTKAKEIIKKLKALYFSPVVTKDDVKRQDEILNEAELFISEEEK